MALISKSKLAEPIGSASEEFGRRLPFVLAGCALLLVLLPELLALACGWRKNDCFPAVVGLGDQTTVRFEQQITSLKGYWNGRVETNANVLQATKHVGRERASVAGVTHSDYHLSSPSRAHVIGSTKQSEWGKRKINALENESHPMWALISIPKNVDSWAHQDLSLTITVHAEYPADKAPLTTRAWRAGTANVGQKVYKNNRKEFLTRRLLKVSGRYSGTIYKWSWMIGHLGGTALLFGVTCISFFEQKTLRDTETKAVVELNSRHEVAAVSEFAGQSDSIAKTSDDPAVRGNVSLDTTRKRASFLSRIVEPLMVAVSHSFTFIDEWRELTNRIPQEGEDVAAAKRNKRYSDASLMIGALLVVATPFGLLGMILGVGVVTWGVVSTKKQIAQTRQLDHEAGGPKRPSSSKLITAGKLAFWIVMAIMLIVVAYSEMGGTPSGGFNTWLWAKFGLWASMIVFAIINAWQNYVGTGVDE